MFPFNKYPYTDFHELNLDWVLKEIKKINSQLAIIIKKLEDAGI